MGFGPKNVNWRVNIHDTLLENSTITEAEKIKPPQIIIISYECLHMSKNHLEIFPTLSSTHHLAITTLVHST